MTTKIHNKEYLDCLALFIKEYRFFLKPRLKEEWLTNIVQKGENSQLSLLINEILN